MSKHVRETSILKWTKCQCLQKGNRYCLETMGNLFDSSIPQALCFDQGKQTRGIAVAAARARHRLQGLCVCMHLGSVILCSP